MTEEIRIPIYKAADLDEQGFGQHIMGIAFRIDNLICDHCGDEPVRNLLAAVAIVLGTNIVAHLKPEYRDDNTLEEAHARSSKIVWESMNLACKRKVGLEDA
jgi:hypothetical protein